jgi:hypothetical protein
MVTAVTAVPFFSKACVILAQGYLISTFAYKCHHKAEMYVYIPEQTHRTSSFKLLETGDVDIEAL